MDYVEKFSKQTRRKADPELIGRWQWDMMRNGDKTIKNQIAAAKRTSTALGRAAREFENLKPAQTEAMHAAARAMRSIAAELNDLAAWARDFKKFYDQEIQNERDAQVAEFAQLRWGANKAAQDFELAVIRDLLTATGRIAFASWVHSSGEYQNFALEDIHNCFDLMREGPTAAHRMFDALTNARRHDYAWTSYDGKRIVVCGRDKYEQYLLYCQAAANTARSALNAARTRETG